METYFDEQCLETAKLIKLVDRFFDCLNGRSQSEAIRKKKPDLMPYSSPDDPRFNVSRKHT